MKRYHKYVPAALFKGMLIVENQLLKQKKDVILRENVKNHKDKIR